MLFSLLIANYNNGHFFDHCYNSIISQSYKNWEVIIFDDGSTDNSLDLIKKIVGSDKRFRIYFSNKNHGCGYTKAKCATLAKGELLGFLDPDDALVYNALEIMVAKHQEQPNTAIITSKYYLVNNNLNIIRVGEHGDSIPKNKSYLTYGKGAFTAFATFKKEYYQKTVGINPTMKRAVDQDLYLKMEEQGHHTFLNLPLYFYRIHSNSISQNENLFKAEYWHFYAMKKAYKRRKTFGLEIDNFKPKEFEKLKMDYYLKRLERSKNTSRYCSLLYFFIKARSAHLAFKLAFLKSVE